jgi:hypothetical protein
MSSLGGNGLREGLDKSFAQVGWASARSQPALSLIGSTVQANHGKRQIRCKLPLPRCRLP